MNFISLNYLRGGYNFFLFKKPSLWGGFLERKRLRAAFSAICNYYFLTYKGVFFNSFFVNFFRASPISDLAKPTDRGKENIESP